MSQGRDWGARRAPAAPLGALFASLEVRDDRYERFALERAGRGRWAARTYCGCEPDSGRCRCAAGHGDTPREALAELLTALP